MSAAVNPSEVPTIPWFSTPLPNENKIVLFAREILHHLGHYLREGAMLIAKVVVAPIYLQIFLVGAIASAIFQSIGSDPEELFRYELVFSHDIARDLDGIIGNERDIKHLGITSPGKALRPLGDELVPQFLAIKPVTLTLRNFQIIDPSRMTAAGYFISQEGTTTTFTRGKIHSLGTLEQPLKPANLVHELDRLQRRQEKVAHLIIYLREPNISESAWREIGRIDPKKQSFFQINDRGEVVQPAVRKIGQA